MSLKSFCRAFASILVLIFITFLITVCFGGFKFNFAKAKENVEFFEDGSFVIFVGGNVENEGEYKVRYSTTYGELFDVAKILNTDSLKRFNRNEAISPYEDFIICNFENFANKNINYATCEGLVDCGISLAKAENIVNYIKGNGYISDKNELLSLELLTSEEFEEVKYKIYAYII